MQKLLSIAEFSERTSLKRGTIRLWAKQRKIASVQLGRRRLIPESELTRLIETNLMPALLERSVR